MPKPSTFLWAAFAAFAVHSGSASAQEVFPSKPIQMILPTSAGSGTDISMRKLASVASPILGQQIVIVNRPGASGMLGTSLVARAAPDGYTIGGIWSAPLTMAPHFERAAYKLEDLVVVASVGTTPGVFCVQNSFPAKTGKEFLEELRRNPGKYTYGTDGIGGFVHMAGERAFAAAGVKAVAVPFPGAAQTLGAFTGGHIDIYGGGVGVILQSAKDGRAKCLLVTSVERDATLPNVDSLTDVGLADAETVSRRMIIGPTGIPSDRMAKLEAAFRQAQLDPAFRQFAESRGEPLWIQDSPKANKVIAQEYQAFGLTAQKLGLKKN